MREITRCRMISLLANSETVKVFLTFTKFHSKIKNSGYCFTESFLLSANLYITWDYVANKVINIG